MPITQEEQQFIKAYAERFCEYKGEESSEKNKRGSDTALAYDIKGFSGELAIHKHFLVRMPDFDKRYSKRDMLIGFDDKKLVCDIKTSIYSKGDYWGNRYKVMGIYQGVYNSNIEKKEIDIFIAVEMNWNNTEADILGIISWKQFLKNKEIITFSKSSDTIPCVNIKYLSQIGDEFTYIKS